MTRKKLAIVGFSERSRDFAPYDDPEWEIWGCNHVYRFVPRVDVLFEIHRIGDLETRYGPEKWAVYSEYLRTTEATVWMMDERAEFPKVKRLPIEALEAEFAYQLEHVEYEGFAVGKRKVTERRTSDFAQFKSTLSYMLCMALMEKRFEEIAVYGVDMTVDSEYWFQRNNLSFYMGWARGAGVKLRIPENSALLREGGFIRYGYESGTAEKYKDLIAERGKRVKEHDAALVAMDNENEVMVAEMRRLEGKLAVVKALAADNSFNGHQERFVGEAKLLEAEYAALRERQRVHFLKMYDRQGRRNESFELMKQLGFHNRGEMPEGRA